MSANQPDFVAIAISFIAAHMTTPLADFILQDAQRPDTIAGRQGLRAGVLAWIADIETGRGDAALEQARFAAMLETIWMLSVVTARTTPGQADPDWVDLYLEPEGARLTALATSAARALDLLRGTDVAGTFTARQHILVERIAAVAGARVEGNTGH